MKIETSFGIEDEVFFMHENKVQKDTVKKISITVENKTNADERTIDITYDMANTTTSHGSPMRKDESEIFETKEELLETL